jgi:hypothetical protein
MQYLMGYIYHLLWREIESVCGFFISLYSASFLAAEVVVRGGGDITSRSSLIIVRRCTFSFLYSLSLCVCVCVVQNCRFDVLRAVTVKNSLSWDMT